MDCIHYRLGHAIGWTRCLHPRAYMNRIDACCIQHLLAFDLRDFEYTPTRPQHAAWASQSPLPRCASAIWLKVFPKRWSREVRCSSCRRLPQKVVLRHSVVASTSIDMRNQCLESLVRPRAPSSMPSSSAEAYSSTYRALLMPVNGDIHSSLCLVPSSY